MLMSEATPRFGRLALIGIGLIGSSIARVAKARGDIARTVVAHARSAQTLDRVLDLMEGSYRQRVFRITEKGVPLVEIAPGVTVDEIREKTGCPVDVPANVPTVQM